MKELLLPTFETLSLPNGSVKMSGDWLNLLKAKLKRVPFFIWLFETWFAKVDAISVWVQVIRVASKFLVFRGKEKTIRVSIDLSQAPPTLGDFLNLLMLSRVLATAGIRVQAHLWTSDERLPASWKEVGLRSYSEMLGPWNDLNRWLGSPLLGLSNSLAERKVLAVEKAELTIPSWPKVIPRVLAVVWVLFPTSETRAAFFLDEFKFKNDELSNLGLTGNFVTLNVRNSSYDPTRNLAGEELEEQLAIIRKRHPDSKVVVLMDKPDHSLFNSDWISGWNSESRIILQPADGYIGAARLLLSSKHYYQRLGGGLNFIATFSRVPFDISIRSLYGAPRPFRKSRWAPWSTDNQTVRVQERLDTKV